MHMTAALQSRPFDLSYTSGGDMWSARLGRKERILVDPQSIYLYDRGPQADGLEELIHERDDREHRPLAFIVSGPEPEYHEALHQRLTQLPLPNSLLGSRHAANRMRALDLPDGPSLLASTTEKRVRDYLRGPLEARDRNAKSILGHLEPGLTYIRAMVNVRSSLGASEKVIKALLNILNNPEQCPDLPDDRALCVGISLYWGKDEPSEVTRQSLQEAFPEEDYEGLRFRVLKDLESPRKRTRHPLDHPTGQQSESWPLSCHEVARPGAGSGGSVRQGAYDDARPRGEIHQTFRVRKQHAHHCQTTWKTKPEIRLLRPTCRLPN